MHRIDTEGNASGHFTDGNPSTGTQATVVDSEWLNAVQDELENVVTDDGGPSLSKTLRNQVITRLKALFGRVAQMNNWLLRQTFVQGIQFGSGPSYPVALDNAGSGRLTDLSLRNLAVDVDATVGSLTSTGLVKGTDLQLATPYATANVATPNGGGLTVSGNGGVIGASISATVATAGYQIGKLSDTDPSPMTLQASVDIPTGATITSVELWGMSNGSGTNTLTVSAYVRFVASATPQAIVTPGTLVAVNLSGAQFAASMSSAMGSAWTARTIPSAKKARVEVVIQTGSLGTFSFVVRGIAVGFTMASPRP